MRHSGLIGKEASFFTGARRRRRSVARLKGSGAAFHGFSTLPLDFSQFTNRNPPGDSKGSVLGAGVTCS